MVWWEASDVLIVGVSLKAAGFCELSSMYRSLRPFHVRRQDSVRAHQVVILDRESIGIAFGPVFEVHDDGHRERFFGIACMTQDDFSVFLFMEVAAKCNGGLFQSVLLHCRVPADGYKSEPSSCFICCTSTFEGHTCEA
jgi:hypothetical protein